MCAYIYIYIYIYIDISWCIPFPPPARESEQLRQRPGYFDRPVGIAVRPDGKLLVASDDGARVQLMTRWGSPLQVIYSSSSRSLSIYLSIHIHIYICIYTYTHIELTLLRCSPRVFFPLQNGRLRPQSFSQPGQAGRLHAHAAHSLYPVPPARCRPNRVTGEPYVHIYVHTYIYIYIDIDI